MKSLVVALIAAAIALATNTVEAKPPKTKSAKAAPKALACELDELAYWGTPDPDMRASQQMIVVLLKCTNNGKGKVRFQARDVLLINSAGDKYGPDRDSDNLDTIYGDMIYPPTFVDRFVEIAAGDTVKLGFTFSGDDGLTDDHLTVDVNGVQFHHQRESKPSDRFTW